MSDLVPMQHPASSFDIVMRGYDRAQVEEHLDRLDADLRIAAADRDAAAARSADLASQLASTHGEIESLRAKLEQTGLPTYERMGERIAGMLTMAEAEGDDIRRKAHEDTAALRAERATLEQEISSARAAAAREQEDLTNRTRHEREQLENAARTRAASLIADADRKTTLTARAAEQRAAQITEAAGVQAAAVETAAGSRAAELTAQAEQHASQVTAEADQYAAQTRTTAEQYAAVTRSAVETEREQADAARQRAEEEAAATLAATDARAVAARHEADEDFLITLNARRAEEADADRARHTRSVEDAHDRIAAATAQAQQMVDEAQAQVDDMTRLRSHILGQLRALRDLIDGMPALAGIGADE
ncbi:MAG: DivIVA domain-containing protein [Mycobacteriales bacterium]